MPPSLIRRGIHRHTHARTHADTHTHRHTHTHTHIRTHTHTNTKLALSFYLVGSDRQLLLIVLCANETLEVCVCLCVFGGTVVPLYINDINNITINHVWPLWHWEINQQYKCNAFYFVAIYSQKKKKKKKTFEWCIVVNVFLSFSL